MGNHWGDNRLGHDRVYNRWGHWGKVVDSRVTSVGDGWVGNSLVVDQGGHNLGTMGVDKRLADISIGLGSQMLSLGNL